MKLELMIKQVLGLVFAAYASSSGAAPCNLSAQSLLGSWEGVGKPAFFEQMSFEEEGGKRTFDSWLHERPEVSGAEWDLADCTLTLRESSGSTQTFRVSLPRGRLLLSRPDGRVTSTYRKIKEQR
jgi:hypothetical protein